MVKRLRPSCIYFAETLELATFEYSRYLKPLESNPAPFTTHFSDAKLPYLDLADVKVHTTLGVRTNGAGDLMMLRKRDFELPPEGPLIRAKTWMSSSAFFLVGYGGRATSHMDTDDFDFADPYFRLRQIQSLFDSRARLTDPVEFLTRVHYRGIRDHWLAGKSLRLRERVGAAERARARGRS